MPTVVPYDQRWPAQYAAAAQELRAATGDLFVELEHLGSTSVPGLAAKPLIDIAAAVHSLDDVRAAEPALAAIGFVPDDFGAPGRLWYVRRRDDVTTHHLHVFPLSRWPELNERLLRDHLRAHPDAAQRYGALKLTLAADGVDGMAYTRAKTALIQELTDAARAERGLPSVPVWEE